MDLRDAWRLDATEQAALVRRRDVTPRELVEEAIARIADLNPRINAVITPLYDRALERAARVPPDARFAGVPILVKDACLEIEGTPYYLGNRALRDIDHRSTQTTELARRIERAGFIIVAKTNTPEFSAGITTEPVAFGPSRNPWDTTRSPGGSSGGSAAAVAAGMTAVAHGGDAGGSLRYPAAACGVATLKPTRGRMPHVAPADQPDLLEQWCEFVLARSVRDLAGALDALANPQRFTAPPAPSRLRVGLLTRDVMANMPVDAACVEAVRATGRLLESLGHEVEETHPPALDGLYVRTWSAFTKLLPVLRSAQLRWLAGVLGREVTPDDVEPANYVPPEQYGAVSGPDLAEAVVALRREVAPVHDWWDAHDVLVTPTLIRPAWPLGSNGGVNDAGAFPPVFSMTGQPAMSLPLAVSGSGLPVGVQLVAARDRDGLLLDVAAQLEAAAPWRDRWPALASEAAASA